MSAAIERLRYYAVKRPSFIRQARVTTGVEDSNGPGPMRSWLRMTTPFGPTVLV